MNFLKNIYKKIVNVFKQGLTPKQLALSLTVCIVVTLFPIYGITTIILTVLALRLKLNLPIMIVVSYVIEPLKLLLVIPFIKLGGAIFKVEHKLLDLMSIKNSLKETSLLETVGSLSFELICGFAGWLILVVPLSIPFYLLLKFILNLAMRNKEISVNVEN